MEHVPRDMREARPMRDPRGPKPMEARPDRPVRDVREMREARPMRDARGPKPMEARPERPVRIMEKRSRPVKGEDHGIQFDRSFREPMRPERGATRPDFDFRAPDRRGPARDFEMPERPFREGRSPSFDREIRPIRMEKDFRQPNFNPKW